MRAHVQTDGMRTELVSEPGDRARPNEDFASVGVPACGQGGSLVVLDGVSHWVPTEAPEALAETILERLVG